MKGMRMMAIKKWRGGFRSVQTLRNPLGEGGQGRTKKGGVDRMGGIKRAGNI